MARFPYGVGTAGWDTRVGMEDLSRFLRPNRHVDSDHPQVVAFAHDVAGGLSPREAAVALHDVVRERLRYTAWRVSFSEDAYRASAVLQRSWDHGGHCIDKALLLAASARALGIPARMHYANVRNHVGTVKLVEALGTDLMVFHGYTELHLGGRWVAATPAFNRSLCERLGVAPLEFDGVNDSIFQENDGPGGRFMEYVTDHGAFEGVPFALMIRQWEEHYPHFARERRWGSAPEGSD